MRPRHKSDLLGGVILCALPATILFAMHARGAPPLPMPWPILFATFFVYGIRSLLTGLLGLPLESPASWLFDAAGAAGLAVFAFRIAWAQTDAGNARSLPRDWDDNVARVLFTIGSLVAALVALRCLYKAFNQFRNKPDDAIRHV
jgi:hypothetical protein